MKKLIIIFIFLLLCLNVEAKQREPKYKIIANSNSEKDIEEIYEIKKNLLLDYKEWCKGVDDNEQTLYDHQNEYNAIYKNGIFLIKIGNADGKELNGTLKINYCENTNDIEQKSLIWDFLF